MDASLLADSDDVIQNGRMQGAFETASRFMTAGPQDKGAASFKAWQHDPKAVSTRQFHEALQAEASDGKVGDLASEPGLTGSPDPDGHSGRAAFSPAAVFQGDVYLKFSAHDAHRNPRQDNRSAR
jgi:hypothetical protein